MNKNLFKIISVSVKTETVIKDRQSVLVKTDTKIRYLRSILVQKPIRTLNIGKYWQNYIGFGQNQY